MTYTGYLQLEVGKKRNKSVVMNSFYDGVLRITRPTYLLDDLPLLTLIHVGGGYVDGDSYYTEMVVQESSRLAVTTLGSTKVYKSPRYGATQTMNYFLKDHSELYVKQDSLILYKDANFSQSVNVYMSSSATFFYTDIITPGWSEDGAPFKYKRVSSKTKIFVEGSLGVFDHLLLQPNEQLENLMYLEGYTHIGMMFFIHERVNNKFVEEIRTALTVYSNQARMGVSILSIKGISLRILAHSTTTIEKILTDCENFIQEKLGSTDTFQWRKG